VSGVAAPTPGPAAAAPAQGIAAPTPYEQAAALKEAGNKAYLAKGLPVALQHYTDALVLDPENVTYLLNR
jgi:hypothetical protein